MWAVRRNEIGRAYRLFVANVSRLCVKRGVAVGRAPLVIHQKERMRVFHTGCLV